MHACMRETAKTFHGCFSVFVLVLYLWCATVDIKLFGFISVSFQFHFNCADTINAAIILTCAHRNPHTLKFSSYDNVTNRDNFLEFNY